MREVVDINSPEPVDTVIGQDPRPGTKVTKGTACGSTSRWGRSRWACRRGRAAVESATSTLQAAGFSVARKDVD